jgi:hypothetical protein
VQLDLGIPEMRYESGIDARETGAIVEIAEAKPMLEVEFAGAHAEVLHWTGPRLREGRRPARALQ